MSEVLHQSAPTRKPTWPSKPPTNKKKLCKVDKKEVESLCEAVSTVVLPTTVDTKEEEKKEIPGTVPVAEQTYLEGELWQLKEPATVDELMGQIPDDSPVEVHATCLGCQTMDLNM